MSGNDRRVRRTRSAVQRALIELILEKGYDAVTVTDIINRADVGRSTFYAHFSDKHDVLSSNLDEVAAFLRRAPAPPDGDLFGFSLPLFRHVAERRRLLRAILGRRAHTAVTAHVEHFVGDLIRDDILRALPPGVPPPPDLDLLVTGVTGAFMALLSRWADTDPHPDPRVVDTTFRELVVPGVRAVLAQG